MSSAKRRVLILENDSRVLERLVGYLRSPHLSLVACSEVEAAECLIDRDQFDMLVTDLEEAAAGRLDGMRLIRQAACRSPRTSVILMAERIDAEARALGRGLGVLDLVDKQGDLERVRDLVDAGLPARPLVPTGEVGDVSLVGPLADVLRSGAVSALLQPIMSLDPGHSAPRLLGVEGLARGPAESMLRDPEMLLDYASRKDELLETETQCLEAVLAEATHLPRVGKLFVKIRPQALGRASVAAGLRDQVRRHGFHESDVVVELPEPRSVADFRALDVAQSALLDRGFRLALDDYGSGLASLHSIQRLELAYLKIDSTFAAGIHRDPRKQVIVRSTVAMARELELATILEGVETQADLDVVAGLGVDYAQGLVFSKPVPGRDLAMSLEAALAVRSNDSPRARSRQLPTAQTIRLDGDAMHELANLVAGIALLADQTMKWATTGDPPFEDLRLIRESGERAVELTRRLQAADETDEWSSVAAGGESRISSLDSVRER